MPKTLGYWDEQRQTLESYEASGVENLGGLCYANLSGEQAEAITQGEILAAFESACRLQPRS